MLLHIKKLQNQLKKEQFDSILVSSPANIRYLSGFTSEECWLLITQKRCFFLGDFRYILQAKEQVHPFFEIKKTDHSVFRTLAELAESEKLGSIYFEPRHINYSQYSLFIQTLPKKVRFLPAAGLIEKMRIIKSDAEIDLIKKAVLIVKKTLKTIKPFIKPGISELTIKNKLEIILKDNGSASPAFDIIVASGTNAAMPHAVTTTRKIKPNEPVIIDIGATYKGYKSDLTRTFFSGKISQYVEYYKLLATAQDRAIKLVRPQVMIQSLDKQARAVLSKQGLNQYFGHALGHGVGLEVHEAPYISGKNKQKLQKSMVFTVEPGIYIPNSGGIRLEDMVLVTEKGCEIL